MGWKTTYGKFGVVDENTKKQKVSTNRQRSSSSLLRAISKKISRGSGASSKEKLFEGFIFVVKLSFIDKTTFVYI